MALTRTLVELKLVSRTRQFLLLAGMSTTVIGTNRDLDDAIDSALRDVGSPGSSTGMPIDVDLIGVLDADANQLIDVAQLRLLESIEGNVVAQSITTGPLSETFKSLRPMIDALRLQINQRYGNILAGEIRTGVLVVTSRPSDDFP